MVTEAIDRDVVSASEKDVPEIQECDALLRRLLDQAPPRPRARLVGAEGDEIDLPEPIYRLLRRIVPLLLNGDSIALMPYHKELTTQQAADFLNMSRQYLVRLLDQEEIPYTKVGTHRRVAFKDLLEYQARRQRRRKAGLARMTALADDAGEYD